MIGVGRARRASTRPTSGPPTPRRPRALADGCSATATRCWSRARARSGSSGSPTRWRLGAARHWLLAGALASEVARRPIDRGEVLIAGMAAMLITIFLGPKFIEFLRVREFGQQIREEGPQEHHAKAGTPTMGGLIIFLAISVPYLVLSDRDTQSLAVFGVALGCAAHRLRRRLHQDLQAPLARALRPATSCSPRSRLAVGLWYVATEVVGLDPVIELAGLRRRARHRARGLPDLRLPGHRRRVQRRQPHRRPRRPRRGLRARSSCSPTWRSRITTGQEGLALLSACLVGACIGFLWFNAFPASIFMGDTGLARARAARSARWR